MALHVVPPAGDPSWSWDDLPEVLTVEEAAKVLRIGRGAAYALANEYLDSDGRDGMPAKRLGRNIRVTKTGLRRYLELDEASGQ
jgi:excisionase family DNA binding protein